MIRYQILIKRGNHTGFLLKEPMTDRTEVETLAKQWAAYWNRHGQKAEYEVFEQT